MANKPFDREVVNNLEKALSSDINTAQSYSDRTLREFIRSLLAVDPTSTVTGFINGSWLVKPTTPNSMSVDINPGLGFIDAPSDEPSSIGSVVGVDDLASLKPLPLAATQVLAIDAAPVGGSNRIDIIEVSYDRRLTDSTSVDILNPTTGVFAPGLRYKTLAWALDGLTGRVVTPNPSTAPIGYKVGAVATAGSEVAPAVTTGYVKIAEVHLIGGTTTVIATGNLTDSRLGCGLPLLAGVNQFTGVNSFAANVKLLAELIFGSGTGPYLARGSGGELTLIGALAAGSAGNDVLIDTLVNRTAGWLFRICNNGVQKYTFPPGFATAGTDVLTKDDIVPGDGAVASSAGWTIISQSVKRATDGLVTLNLKVSYDSGIIPSLGTIQSGYRPPAIVMAPGWDETGTAACVFWIQTNGTFSPSGVTTGHTYWLEASYYV